MTHELTPNNRTRERSHAAALISRIARALPFGPDREADAHIAPEPCVQQLRERAVVVPRSQQRQQEIAEYEANKEQ